MRDTLACEAIAEANPDVLYVVDRDAAIGQESEAAEQVLPVVERLHRAASTDQAADLHFVKGSADNMGLTELATICRRAEAALAMGTAPDLSGLRGAYERGRAALLRPAA